VRAIDGVPGTPTPVPFVMESAGGYIIGEGFDEEAEIDVRAVAAATLYNNENPLKQPQTNCTCNFKCLTCPRWPACVHKSFSQFHAERGTPPSAQ
jgi:hypothetical protein